MASTTAPSPLLRAVTLLAVAVGALSTAGVMLMMAEGGDGSWAAMLGFLAWATAPFFALGIVAWRLRAAATQWAGLLCALLITVPAVAIYGNALVDADAQASFVFLFVPLYQLLVTPLVLGLGWIVATVIAKRASP